VLGPITVGDNARIGANAVVVDSVPNDTTVVGIPARTVDRALPRDRKTMGFDPYGIPCDGELDPLLHDLDQMHCELADLEERVARLAEAQMQQRRAVAE
jgi:serine O-acetyltransferase